MRQFYSFSIQFNVFDCGGALRFFTDTRQRLTQQSGSPPGSKWNDIVASCQLVASNWSEVILIAHNSHRRQLLTCQDGAGIVSGGRVAGEALDLRHIDQGEIQTLISFCNSRMIVSFLASLWRTPKTRPITYVLRQTDSGNHHKWLRGLWMRIPCVAAYYLPDGHMRTLGPLNLELLW